MKLLIKEQLPVGVVALRMGGLTAVLFGAG